MITFDLSAIPDDRDAFAARAPRVWEIETRLLHRIGLARASLVPLVLFCAAHFFIDLYSASLGVLQPLLLEQFGLTFTHAGILGGVFTGAGLALWYHFAIMFEAVFILTALDTGTRVARYLFQDVAKRVWAPLGSTTNMWSVAFVGAVVCFSWGYLMATGSVETIWPLFGVSNQLLAVIALAVGTTFLLRQRPPAYALVTFLPLCFLTVTTGTAGVLNTFRYLSPAYIAEKGPFVSYLDGILSIVLLLLVGTVLTDSFRRWAHILAERRRGAVEIPLARVAGPARPAEPAPPVA